MIKEPWKKTKWEKRRDAGWRLFLLLYVAYAVFSIAFAEADPNREPIEWNTWDRITGILMILLIVNAGWELFVWQAERRMQKFVNNAVKEEEERLAQK